MQGARDKGDKESLKTRISYHSQLRDGSKVLDKPTEFKITQQMYTESAETYEQNTQNLNYQGFLHVAQEIELLYPDNKDIRILDYGCGTGLVAEELVKRGYTNVDGLDPNKELIAQALKKGVVKKTFTMKSGEDLTSVGSKVYDVVCSSGVFFVAASYPGYEDVVEISKLVKQGGHMINVTGHKYLQCKYVDRTPILEAEKRGVLKIFPDKVSPGYRGTVEAEGYVTLDAVIMTYQVL